MSGMLGVVILILPIVIGLVPIAVFSAENKEK